MRFEIPPVCLGLSKRMRVHASVPRSSSIGSHYTLVDGSDVETQWSTCTNGAQTSPVAGAEPREVMPLVSYRVSVEAVLHEIREVAGRRHLAKQVLRCRSLPRPRPTCTVWPTRPFGRPARGAGPGPCGKGRGGKGRGGEAGRPPALLGGQFVDLFNRDLFFVRTHGSVEIHVDDHTGFVLRPAPDKQSSFGPEATAIGTSPSSRRAARIARRPASRRRQSIRQSTSFLGPAPWAPPGISPTRRPAP